MTDQHHSHPEVLQSGADYLDGVAADMESQAGSMEEQAGATHIPQVRAGYERFAEALRHCAQTLREKSRDLRGV